MFRHCKQDASMSSEWKAICNGAELKFRTREIRKLLASTYAKLSDYLYHKPDHSSCFITTRSVTHSHEFAKIAKTEINALRIKMMEDRTIEENVRDCFNLLEKLNLLYQEKIYKSQTVIELVKPLFIYMLDTHPKSLTKDELTKMRVEIFARLNIPIEKEIANKMQSVTP